MNFACPFKLQKLQLILRHTIGSGKTIHSPGCELEPETSLKAPMTMTVRLCQEPNCLSETVFFERAGVNNSNCFEGVHAKKTKSWTLTWSSSGNHTGKPASLSTNFNEIIAVVLGAINSIFGVVVVVAKN